MTGKIGVCLVVIATWAALADLATAQEARGFPTPEGLFEEYVKRVGAGDWKGMIELYEPRALQHDYGRFLQGWRESLDMYEKLPPGQEKQIKKGELEGVARSLGLKSIRELRDLSLPDYAVMHIRSRYADELRRTMGQAKLVRIEVEPNRQRALAHYTYPYGSKERTDKLYLHRTGKLWYLSGSEQIEIDLDEVGQGND